MSKRTIKKLIGRGYLEEAIELMLELVEKYANGSDVENTLYNISGQYYSNESGKRGSTLTTEAYNTARNRLNGNLSDILDDSFLDIDENDIPDSYKQLLKGGPSSPEAPEAPEAPESESAKKILVLSANPASTDKIDVDKERARIGEKLEKSGIEVVSRRRVSRSRFAELIYEEKPTIVHFSGHGEEKDPTAAEGGFVNRGIGKRTEQKPDENAPQSGILLMDEDGRNASFLKANVLKRTFNTLVNKQDIKIKAVILNACYSEEQARAISEVGVSVIGTSSAIKDNAAIKFSSGFYYAYGKGESIEDALDWAINLVLDDEPEDRFILYKNGEKQDI